MSKPNQSLEGRVGDIVRRLYRDGFNQKEAQEATHQLLELINNEVRKGRKDELERIQKLDDGKRQLANVMLAVQVHIKDRLAELSTDEPLTKKVSQKDGLYCIKHQLNHGRKYESCNVR